MRVRFFPEDDSALIDLTEREHAVEETTEVTEGPGAHRIWLDFDAEGHLLGLEVMHASRYLHPLTIQKASRPGVDQEQVERG